ncbi:MAG: DAK2 domain-containing protein [Thermoleophilia bacterium]|nr:DAK2 domain-containing protein [Thermoleophilia bacterium]
MNNEGARLTAPAARALLAAGLGALEARKQEINDLNVYPVPDGDTGTNLALTMRSLLTAATKMPDDISEHDLCTALTQAALMGARGNSGVILSQIIRGAMEVLGRGEPVAPDTITEAFQSATETAYRAVRRPVEGTMLTVLREMAEAAEAAPQGLGRESLMAQVIAAGWKSVEKTPSLLRVLADAGVVDAGGYGLVVLLEGTSSGRADRTAPIATRIDQSPVQSAVLYEEEATEEESEFTYCTSFLVSGQGLDQTLLEEQLSRLGDSLLVVGDSTQLKIHVHTDHPDEVLGFGLAQGLLSEIEIDNMKEQTAARIERLARAASSAPADAGLTQVVAVVAGEGNKALFRSLGVDLIVDGGQSMNPSAEDLMRAVERAVAPSVIILPNNSNVIMTAEQTVGLTGREVYVVPTSSIQAGLSAAVAFEKRCSGDENAAQMREVIDNVTAGEITRAVRDSTVDGVVIKGGEFLGLIDDHVVVSSLDMTTAIGEVVALLLSGRREMLTALLGEGDDADEAAAAIESLRDKYPQVEIDVHDGGQPFYPVLLAAE